MPRAKQRRNLRLTCQQLEERQLMAADLGNHIYDPGVVDRIDAIDPRLFSPISALHSNPGASSSLYLDFDGHDQGTWTADGLSFYNAETPIFSLDDDVTSFNNAELQMIEQIWQRVAEDFAPFDIDVTTVEPSSFDNGAAIRVAIGGSWNDWYGAQASGVAGLDSFTDDDPPVVYVFSEDAVDTWNQYIEQGLTPPYDVADGIANVASHEAGHSLGLKHQPLIQGNILVDEYHPGGDLRAPIMGDSFSGAERTTWATGEVLTGAIPEGSQVFVTQTQDELAILADRLGMRADDHSDNYKTPTPLVPGIKSTFTGSGIIETVDDLDYFTFDSNGGRIKVSVNVAELGANLDARVELWRLQKETRPFGQIIRSVPILVASADPGDSLDATLQADVAAGCYLVVVAGHGTYGDVGQYTVDVALLKGAVSQLNKEDFLHFSQYASRGYTSTTTADRYEASPPDSRAIDAVMSTDTHPVGRGVPATTSNLPSLPSGNQRPMPAAALKAAAPSLPLATTQPHAPRPLDLLALDAFFATSRWAN